MVPGIIMLSLNGCVSTSNVVPLGNGTYHIAASDKGGVFSSDGKVVSASIKKAEIFCKRENKHAEILKLDRSDEGPFKFESSDIIFRCK